MQERRQPEIIAGRVNTDGSIAAGDGFSVQKGTAGVYTVTLAPGFRLIGVTATGVTQGGAYGSGVAPGERSFQVSTFVTTTGVATDAMWWFIAVGVQT